MNQTVCEYHRAASPGTGKEAPSPTLIRETVNSDFIELNERIEKERRLSKMWREFVDAQQRRLNRIKEFNKTRNSSLKLNR